MTAVVPLKATIPSLAMNEAELIAVLSSSIYPGAKPESIKLAIGYCKAAGLDPLQKPVHIVPMDVKTGQKGQDGKDIYEKRDVIMPGVGLYRVQAARSQGYAGMSEPEFGPEKSMELGKDDKRMTYTFPEWCKVTVRRVVNGQSVDFTAVEYWIENYATAGNWTTEPNKMWKKRPRGQLAKCAEAQALRKAFPEIGAAPTADEMEGKTIEAEVIQNLPQVEGPKSTAPEASAPNTSAPAAAPKDTVGPGEGEKLSAGAIKTLKDALTRASRTEEDLVAAGFPKIDEMQFGKFNACMKWVRENPAKA